MKIGIPVENGKLAMHFGHCKHFALIEIDKKKNEIVSRDTVQAPPHEPGLLPGWLAERGTNLVIAGGMGARAIGLFAEQKIEVIVGAPAESPEDIVQSYLRGNLETGGNVCDH